MPFGDPDRGQDASTSPERHRARAQGKESTFEELEAELLDGQKLQGVLTSDEVQAVLRARGWQGDYPLFTTVNLIVHGRVGVRQLFEYKVVACRHAAEQAERQRESESEPAADAGTMLL